MRLSSTQIQRTVLAGLSKILSAEQIITEESGLDELSWDALSEGRLHPLNRLETALPLCAVRPFSTADVTKIVRLANQETVPLIPYGGGSGLMGGALSMRRGIVLDLRKMNRILGVDSGSRSASAQAGTVLEALEERLNRDGFILGHDPWTLPVATLGGAISTNSVGYRAGLYGSMGDQVLGLEAVLPNGEILRTRAVGKASAGINLNSLLIGGEGCFGIITEATFRIFPKPESRVLAAVLFESFEAGYTAIQKIFLRPLRPALVDFGDDPEHHDSGAVLYLGFEGARQVVEAEEKLALLVAAEAGGIRLPQEEAERFWRDRHIIARRFLENRRQRRERGRDGIYRDWIHVALPGSKVLPFRTAAMEIIERHGARLQESGLWIQPELFSMRLSIESGAPNEAQLTLQETVTELLRLVQKMGGSMEYTHGVGVKLAPLMAGEHGYGLEVMRKIKRAIDPKDIMNPGKMGL
jgi:alkyldihydroxyacetonephosphate synthase